ncbi:hypothetical protein ACI65C_006435 [Semiaphis heraclei]
MDDFTKKWLLNIGFEHLINTFEEEEINKATLFMLTESMIVDLVPKIGQRANFLDQLEKLKKPIEIVLIQTEKKNNIFDNLFEDEGSNSDSCSNFVDEKSSSNIKSSKGIIIFKIINHLIFLKKYIYSPYIYKMENNMCNNCTYVDSFIKQILKKYQDGIEELFPSESEYVYFIPYFREGKNVSPNRGKLYDKYCNIKKEMNKINAASKQLNSCNRDDPVFTNEEDILDSINWLKHNIEPEITLHKLWAETASYRLQKQLNDKNTLKYPALKKSTGYMLNINDLKTTHEEKVNRAFNCGLTVQPYVVIVGNLEEINSTISYYTVINDIHYKLETPIKALDICFKSFHSFNLEYPQEAEQDELSVILGEMKILSAPFENMKTEYKRFETLEKLDV